MMDTYYQNICNGIDVRQNLISLKQELKDELGLRRFVYRLAGDFHELTDLLKHEDPKVRKNAAAILGMMETEDVLPFLFAAYMNEKTLFVRSDYLKAMAQLDYTPYLDKLKLQLEKLEMSETTDENRKHISEETSRIREMILKYEKPKKHRFIGMLTPVDVILVTNRCQRGVTKRQIKEGTMVELGGGIRVRGGNLKELLAVRTYSEMLFPIPSAGALAGTPHEIGAKLAECGIPEFLDEFHTGGNSYYYRLEIKGAVDADKKGILIRRIAEELDRRSGLRLKNVTAGYEIEIRLIQRKDGSWQPLLKLFTIPDRRFAYRKGSVAASISPVNAALTVQLSKPYMKEGAQILDPFCGVGTMLLERNYAVPADPMYGVDLFGEAIEKARENTERAKCTIHYIQKDFFEFTHNYLFDELITDMPRTVSATGNMTLEELYKKFFEYVPRFMKEDSLVILYTMNPELIRRNMTEHPYYELLQNDIINEKNRTEVFIFRLHGNRLITDSFRRSSNGQNNKA